MEKPAQLPEHVRLTRIEQVRAMAHPLRIELLKRLWTTGHPMTVAQLAQSMDQGPTKLHYHVNEMTRLKLLRVARRAKKGSLTERYYEPVASNYRADPIVFEQGTSGRAAQLETIQSILDTASQDIQRLFVMASGQTQPFQFLLHSHGAYRLKPAHAKELIERVRALHYEFRKRESHDADAVELVLTSVAHPRLAAPAEPAAPVVSTRRKSRSS